VLNVLYKNKSALSTVVFAEMILLAPPATPAAKALGQKIGEAAAKEVLALRGYDPATGAFADGSHDVAGQQSLAIEPTYGELQAKGILPGAPGILDWVQDPIVLPVAQAALGGYWNQVQPFVAPATLLPPPPSIYSTDSTVPPILGGSVPNTYYNDIRYLGGDPNPPAIAPRVPTGTTRTNGPGLTVANQTFTGVFWGYDATALLCAPPRLYNMVATSVALNERPIKQVNDLAYYLALVNIAIADAGIAAWTNKFHYHFARPVTALRAINPGAAVLGTLNKNWTPQGGPDTNGPVTSSNFSPPFPAYPSGHATFGGALFQTMRLYFGGDFAFQFVSDEYNGINKDGKGNVRPLAVREFPSLTYAESENARSRIWNGVHWQFDGTSGIALGNQIANAVFTGAFTS